MNDVLNFIKWIGYHEPKTRYQIIKEIEKYEETFHASQLSLVRRQSKDAFKYYRIFVGGMSKLNISKKFKKSFSTVSSHVETIHHLFQDFVEKCNDEIPGEYSMAVNHIPKKVLDAIKPDNYPSAWDPEHRSALERIYEKNKWFDKAPTAHISQLCKFTEKELRRLPGIGKTAVDYVIKSLEKHDYTLKDYAPIDDNKPIYSKKEIAIREKILRNQLARVQKERDKYQNDFFKLKDKHAYLLLQMERSNGTTSRGSETNNGRPSDTMH